MFKVSRDKLREVAPVEVDRAFEDTRTGRGCVGYTTFHGYHVSKGFAPGIDSTTIVDALIESLATLIERDMRAIEIEQAVQEGGEAGADYSRDVEVRRG